MQIVCVHDYEYNLVRSPRGKGHFYALQVKSCSEITNYLVTGHSV